MNTSTNNPFDIIIDELLIIKSELLELKVSSSNGKKDDQENNSLLNVAEAAKFLGVSVPTVYGYLYKNIIPHMKPSGKKIYFFKEELANWVKNSKRKTIEELKADADNLTSKPKKRA